MERIIEAVSAVLVHRKRVFVIQRQFHLRAFPGYFAFPGGKVDQDDATGPTIADWSFPRSQQAALRRELLEELDWDLFENWRQGNVTAIEKLGTALTPPGAQFRFNNHVFLVRLEQALPFTTDPGEIAWSSWLSPGELLQRYHTGSVHMAPPTRMAVEALARDIESIQVDYSVLKVAPDRLNYIEMTHGVGLVPVPSNTLPPATRTTALYLGDVDASKILVDPSPKDRATLQALLATLEDLPLEALLLSHHHQDHHEFLPELAATLDLPVLLTKQTHSNLLRRMGEDYLRDTRLEFIVEGDGVTHWKGQAVRVYELPGHDNGMVGLAPDSLAWMFVADLVEPGTTVVIPEDVGDMRIYMASLQRVIDMNPGVIIPSHGGAQVGLNIVRDTLQHRRQRERQILDLWREGHRHEEVIYQRIYPELPQQLHRLALQNIRMHLRKLVAEAVIDDPRFC